MRILHRVSDRAALGIRGATDAGTALTAVGMVVAGRLGGNRSRADSTCSGVGTIRTATVAVALRTDSSAEDGRRRDTAADLAEAVRPRCPSSAALAAGILVVGTSGAATPAGDISVVDIPAGGIRAVGTEARIITDSFVDRRRS